MVKGANQYSYVVYGAIALAFMVGIVAAVSLVQRRPELGSALQLNADFTFTEDFTTDTYKDAGATTLDWSTATGDVSMFTSAGAFYMADSITPGSENITVSDPNFDQIRSFGAVHNLVFDSQARPHVVWHDTTNGEIKYLRYNGTAWVGLEGAGPDNISDSAFDSCAPSIAIDSLDRPHIAWHEMEGDACTGGSDPSEIHYRTWDGSAWTGQLGSVDNVSGTLATASRTPMIAVDSQDLPTIIWIEGIFGSQSILLMHWNGSAWVGNVATPPDVLTSGGGFIGKQLVLDDDDFPVVMWTPTATGYFGFTRWNGSAYMRADRTTPGSDDSTAIECGAAGSGCALALDSQGEPNMLGTGPGGIIGQDVYFTRWDQATDQWVHADRSTLTPGAENITVSGEFAPSYEYLSLAVDSLDRPIAVWKDPNVSPPDNFLSRWSGSAWSTIDFSGPGATNVSNSAVNAFVNDIAIDSNDSIAMVWNQIDVTTYEIYYTRWIEPCVTSGVAQSLQVAAPSEPIQTATLDASHELLGGSVAYELSNNGGVSFESVTPGSLHTFTTAGSDLRWRATATRGPTLASCPILDSLSIDFSANAIEPIPGPTPDEVVRIPGATPVEQSINVSQARFASVDSAGAGVVTRSDVLIDALTIAPLVSRTTATHLLNPSDHLEASVLAEFNRALPPGATIYIGGGAQAISAAIESELQAAGFATDRLGGEERLQTAALIADEIVRLNPGVTTKVFLAEHAQFADALALGAITGNLTDDQADPILLNRRGESNLHSSTSAFFTTHPAVTAVELVGGPVALHSDLDGLLAQTHPQLTAVSRTQGANRFATNVALAHAGAPQTIVVANGEQAGLPGASAASIAAQTATGAGFFDALLAGPYAAERRAVLLLTRAAELPVEILNYVQDNAGTITSAVIVGSEALVSPAVERQLETILEI
jgi:hypothetical protein